VGKISPPLSLFPDYAGLCSSICILTYLNFMTQSENIGTKYKGWPANSKLKCDKEQRFYLVYYENDHCRISEIFLMVTKLSLFRSV
jgi:hypothetical protein